MNEETIGQRLRRIRKQQGMSASRLSKLTGLSVSHITRIEQSYHNPQSETVKKIADVLHVTTDVLLGSPQPRRSHEDVLAELEALTPLAIPIIAEGSAGEGDGFVEYAYWARPKAAGKNIMGVLVKGDCLEPEVHEGDILFIDTDLLSPRDRDIIMCLMDGRIQIKRYRQEGKKTWLENRYGQLSPKECVIQGIVVEQNIKRR